MSEEASPSRPLRKPGPPPPDPTAGSPAAANAPPSWDTGKLEKGKEGYSFFITWLPRHLTALSSALCGWGAVVYFASRRCLSPRHLSPPNPAPARELGRLETSYVVAHSENVVTGM